MVRWGRASVLSRIEFHAAGLDSIELKPARVEYIDLCEHQDITKSQFFSGSLGLKTLLVYGLTMQAEGMTHVLFYDDISSEPECEESQGIIIPNSCVVNITWLKDAGEQTENALPEGVN
jgi:hypothetical protein